MDKETRSALIRKGNEAFNKGDMNTAAKIFKSAEYKDGLIRLGDYWYYDRKKPLVAVGYYSRAGEDKKKAEIFGRMVKALKHLMKTDEEDYKPKIELPQVAKEDDPLYHKAMEILNNQGK